MRPDSLMPRRFASADQQDDDEHDGDAMFGHASWNCGIEMIAATPADTDTATVRM